MGQAKSKEMLIQEATVSEKGRLQVLGMLLGIQTWSQTFDSRLTLPKDCLELYMHEDIQSSMVSI